jgi:hypothetical protein
MNQRRERPDRPEALEAIEADSSRTRAEAPGKAGISPAKMEG